MGSVAEFFERLDQQQRDTDEDELSTTDGLEQAGAENYPTFRRWAERAGVSLEELLVEARGRMEVPANSMARHVEADTIPLAEALRLIGAAGAMQFFLAGVMWEQEKGLPDLGEVAT